MNETKGKILSQVIVTDDKLRDKRSKSKDQELKILKEAQFSRWRRDDVTKPDVFKRTVGLLTFPILGLWAMICGLIYIVVKVCKVAFGLLGGSQAPEKSDKK